MELQLSLSIIIPAFNESTQIGNTLNKILSSGYQDYEVIVVDNNSTDDTAAIISSYADRFRNVKLVSCRKKGPSAARNAGVASARGDYLLFLDADTEIDKDYLGNSIEEMKRRNLSVANHYLKPRNGNLLDTFMFSVMDNLVIRPLQYVMPTVPGAGGIMIKREIHDRINGFDEHLSLGEDADYQKRASHFGTFRILTSAVSYTDVRRFKQEGRFKTWSRWAKTTAYHIFGKDLHTLRVEYAFGHYDKSSNEYLFMQGQQKKIKKCLGEARKLLDLVLVAEQKKRRYMALLEDEKIWNSSPEKTRGYAERIKKEVLETPRILNWLKTIFEDDKREKEGIVGILQGLHLAMAQERALLANRLNTMNEQFQNSMQDINNATSLRELQIAENKAWLNEKATKVFVETARDIYNEILAFYEVYTGNNNRILAQERNLMGLHRDFDPHTAQGRTRFLSIMQEEMNTIQSLALRFEGFEKSVEQFFMDEKKQEEVIESRMKLSPAPSQR